MGVPDLGKVLIVIGALVVVVGVLLLLGNPLRLGHLPGDISGSSGSVSFAFPIVTCIVVSIVLTVLINVVLRLR